MTHDHQFRLLRERRFGPLFVTQFLGAFNDNIFKNALIIMIAFQAGTSTGQANVLINLAAGLFILPFFLFSASAGQFADKYDKARMIRWVKLLEIAIMSAAFVGFYTHSSGWLILLLFLMGTQSTLFGPLKYSILPQHLSTAELTGGNGMIEMGTFLAILMGTLIGGVLIGLGHFGAVTVAATVVAVAILGYLASLAIPRAAAAAPELAINWNPLTETARNLRFLGHNRTVFLAALGNSWFWFVGAIYLTQLPNYTRLTLGGNEQVVTLLLTLFSIGIGAGSLLCERLSGQRVEIGLVPLGSLGISLFGIDLYLAAPGPLSTGGGVGAWHFLSLAGSWHVVADIVLIGLFGGLYIVPLYALIQSRSPPAHCSRVIAGNNILNALLMVVSAVMAIGLLSAGVSIPRLFLIVALLNVLVAAFIYVEVPEFPLRFLAWLISRLIYRVRCTGLIRIPGHGAALLACNRQSYLDALIIAGCCPRPVHFVMDQRILHVSLLNALFRATGAITLAPDDPERQRRVCQQIDHCLAAGALVAVFPPSQRGRDAEIDLLQQPDIERIASNHRVPVLSLALRGLRRDPFKGEPCALPGRLLARLRRAHLELIVDPPLPTGERTAGGPHSQMAKSRATGR